MTKAREYHLKRTYGISLEQYDSLLKKQKNACAVCKRNREEFKTNFAVDHDHKTGEIFGLLCFNCNHILIGRERRPELYSAAAKYLKKGTGWFVPEKVSRTKRKKKKNGIT